MTRSLSAVGVVVACLFVAACGSGSGNQTDTAKLDAARREGVRQERLREQQLAQRREQQQLKKKVAQLEKESRAHRHGSATPPASTTPASTDAPAASSTSCGGNLSVGASTSCTFAADVESAYFENGGGSGTVRAYSPITKQWYTMTCTAGAPTICRGGNNAVVYIR
jgi:hypothetical protein